MKTKLFFLLAIPFIFMSLTIISCKKDKESEKPSTKSLCKMIHIDNYGISVIHPDTSCTSEWVKTDFNRYGQVTAFYVNVYCGSKSYIVKIFNVRYDPNGNPQSYDATVNDQDCHWEKE